MTFDEAIGTSGPTVWDEIQPLLPVLALVIGGLVALLLVAFTRRPHRRLLLVIGIGSALASIAGAVRIWNWYGPAETLGGMVSADRLALVGAIAIAVCVLAALAFAYDYFDGTERGELTALVLFATAGMTGLVSSANLIMLFISLEVLSLSLYILCGFTLRTGGGEASLKYFLLGAFSSAFFLYGVAMSYGATGTVSISGMADALSSGEASGLAPAAIALLGVGFAFKIAAVPFHMWAPDVYQGAPTPVTAFMAAGTKIAAVIALARVLNEGFGPLALGWSDAVMLLAVVSMVGGSLLAVAQRDVKRLLAYSGVSHAGFILLGLGTGVVGVGPVLYYLITYGLAALGAFGVVMVASGGRSEATGEDTFKGLAHRRPWLAAGMSLFLLSLAGIPPTAGFIAKVGVFSAAAETSFVPIVVIGVLASVVAAYAYLRVVVWMYFDDATHAVSTEAPAAPRARVGTVVAITVPALATLALGILPGLIAPYLEIAGW